MPSSTSHGPFFNGYFAINGIDLSNDCESFAVNEGAASLPNHAHGDGTEQQRPGLLQWQVTGRFYSDFGAGKVYATCTALYRNRTAFAIQCRPDADSGISATNPQWSGSGYFTQLTQLQGTHGDNLMTNFTIVANSDLTVEES